MPADTFTRRKPGRQARDPWAQWTNGDVWRIFPGRDFEVTVKRKQQQLNKYADRHNLDVRTWTETNDEGVVRLSFRFSARQAEQSATAAAENARATGKSRARRLSQALVDQADFPTVLGGATGDFAGAGR